MRIGISTPRGQVGSKIVKRLLDLAQHEIVLLDHRPEKSEALHLEKTEIRSCDVRDCSSLINATQGLDMIYMVIPPDNSSTQYLIDFIEVGKNFAEAIEQNNINHVVFQSSYGAQHPYGNGPITGLFHAEQQLNRTAANVVHLRACYFMENFLWFRTPIEEDGVIPLPVKADSRTIFNTTDDIAERALNWLSNNSWSGKVIDEIHGEQLSFTDITEQIGKQLRKSVQVVELSDTDSLHAFTQPHIGFSQHYARMFNELHRGIDQDTLKAEFRANHCSGVKQSFSEFCQRHF